MNLQLILASILVFLVIILLLVVILLVAKKYLLPSGNVKVTINGENTVEVAAGGTLLGTLAAKVGWKYADVVARDEKERKERAAKWFEKKQLKQKAFAEAKEKILADEKYKAKVEILKKFGYA
jgi:hypothetical protein